MSLREDRNKIIISKIIMSKTTINKTILNKAIKKIQETQETRRQVSTRMLRGKIIVKETRTQKSECTSQVEYAQKPHMEIYLDAQNFSSTFQANQEDQPVHPKRSA